jgi:hypothetical protein
MKYVRLVTGLIKYKLFICSGQVLFYSQGELVLIRRMMEVDLGRVEEKIASEWTKQNNMAILFENMEIKIFNDNFGREDTSGF